MEGDAPFTEKERERASLLEEAARIVRVASAEGRELTTDEDSQVLKVRNRVRVLEEEIRNEKKHPAGHSESQGG